MPQISSLLFFLPPPPCGVPFPRRSFHAHLSLFRLFCFSMDMPEFRLFLVCSRAGMPPSWRTGIPSDFSESLPMGSQAGLQLCLPFQAVSSFETNCALGDVCCRFFLSRSPGCKTSRCSLLVSTAHLDPRRPGTSGPQRTLCPLREGFFLPPRQEMAQKFGCFPAMSRVPSRVVGSFRRSPSLVP